MLQGAYGDTSPRGSDGWHFHERRIRTDGTGDLTLHLRGVQAQAVGTTA